jgi:hypothetical protein
MYSKAEIIEMITRQYDVKQSVIDHMISQLTGLSDEEIMRGFEKASQGARLEKVGSMYMIKF